MSKRNKKGRDINGVLILDKATGHSSNSALQDIKRLFDANKAGHTGSLDPLASGLLPICLGQSTKVAQFLLNDDKRYFVRGKLGQISKTGDSEGQLNEYGSTKHIDEIVLKNTLKDFVGEISQVPPMYSALKVNGKPLYKFAREGINIVRKMRTINIYEIILINFTHDTISLKVTCGRGTYIRSLAKDIAAQLNTVGHLAKLIRTRIGEFDEKSCIELKDFPKWLSARA